MSEPTRIELRLTDLKWSPFDLIVACADQYKKYERTAMLGESTNSAMSRLGYWEEQLGYNNTGNPIESYLYWRLHHRQGDVAPKALIVLSRALKCSIDYLLGACDHPHGPFAMLFAADTVSTQQEEERGE